MSDLFVAVSVNKYIVIIININKDVNVYEYVIISANIHTLLRLSNT